MLCRYVAGPLMGFASTVASLAGFAVPVIVGTLTNGEVSEIRIRSEKHVYP